MFQDLNRLIDFVQQTYGAIILITDHYILAETKSNNGTEYLYKVYYDKWFDNTEDTFIFRKMKTKLYKEVKTKKTL